MADLEKVKSDLYKLKFFLIIITIVELIIFFGFFMDLLPFINNSLSYNQTLGIFAFSHYFGIAMFVWYIWKRFPVNNSNKRYNILMILFLGIIGMWLWMPNKKEIDKLAKS